jgi:hypothetical protein
MLGGGNGALKIPIFSAPYLTQADENTNNQAMIEILIKYRDGSGDITERRISDLRLESASTIDAYCHLRQARRPFRIDRIVHAVDPDTGEVINPWKLVGTATLPDGRETLESLTWGVLPAIKALKFFTLTTRGFRKRERDRVVQFVQEIADARSYSKEEISEWVYKLWCGDLYAYGSGDTSEYTETLRNIPASLLNQCRDYALFIAKGSGRKPIEPSWVERIETEFRQIPNVKKPEKTQNDEFSVIISAQQPEKE